MDEDNLLRGIDTKTIRRYFYAPLPFFESIASNEKRGNFNKITYVFAFQKHIVYKETKLFKIAVFYIIVFQKKMLNGNHTYMAKILVKFFF